MLVKQQEMTILFADVADSVALHDSLGDIVAHEKIVDCLQKMSAIIAQHHGRVVETIGDEIMCVFNTADQAFHAACTIQEVLRKSASSNLNVRVGFNHDLTNIDDGHPFGDPVNMAARMVNLAKAGQIIISQQAYQALSPMCRNQTRHFNRMLIKGKQTACDIYEVLWDRDDSTIKFTRVNEEQYNRYATTTVKIAYHNFEKTLHLNDKRYTIGRGNTCDLQVFTDVASRLHATIKTAQGKLIFTDESTNGSYVRTRPGHRASDDLDLYLHHQDWIMESSGTISLGEPVADNSQHPLFFECF